MNKNRKTPEQKWCEVCRLRLLTGVGIVVGLSVMYGTMKVCSKTCLDKLNQGGWDELLKKYAR